MTSQVHKVWFPDHGMTENDAIQIGSRLIRDVLTEAGYYAHSKLGYLSESSWPLKARVLTPDGKLYDAEIDREAEPVFVVGKIAPADEETRRQGREAFLKFASEAPPLPTGVMAVPADGSTLPHEPSGPPYPDRLRGRLFMKDLEGIVKAAQQVFDMEPDSNSQSPAKLIAEAGLRMANEIILHRSHHEVDSDNGDI